MFVCLHFKITYVEFVFPLCFIKKVNTCSIQKITGDKWKSFIMKYHLCTENKSEGKCKSKIYIWQNVLSMFSEETHDFSWMTINHNKNKMQFKILHFLLTNSYSHANEENSYLSHGLIVTLMFGFTLQVIYHSSNFIFIWWVNTISMSLLKWT